MVEASTHDVVGVASQDGDLVPVLPVPQTHRLVVTRRHYPGQLNVELDSADIVNVPCQCEQTFLHLVVPYFDHLIISTRDKHGLSLMEINTSDRTY